MMPLSGSSKTRFAEMSQGVYWGLVSVAMSSQENDMGVLMVAASK